MILLKLRQWLLTLFWSSVGPTIKGRASMSALQHKTLIINLVIISLERYSIPVERMKSLKITYVWGPMYVCFMYENMKVCTRHSDCLWCSFLYLTYPEQFLLSIVQFWNVLFYFASLYNGIEQIDKYNKNSREQFNVSERKIILIAWLLYSLIFLATYLPVKHHPHNDPVRHAHHLSPFTGKKTEHVAIK